MTTNTKWKLEHDGTFSKLLNDIHSDTAHVYAIGNNWHFQVDVPNAIDECKIVYLTGEDFKNSLVAKRAAIKAYTGFIKYVESLYSDTTLDGGYSIGGERD